MIKFDPFIYVIVSINLIIIVYNLEQIRKETIKVNEKMDLLINNNLNEKV